MARAAARDRPQVSGWAWPARTHWPFGPARGRAGLGARRSGRDAAQWVLEIGW
ncbi:hypothetical protein trd_A0270 (plasmid) [Thermomicrobium roseum DSM 5159]|uniref:Uncharacterized protein n=1 Tax=Thermomicrobium roseum (strain ATCC 27502 / DSM 5159 / P-2) TaxID=309801 RepID=B9L3A6_THERP|nr:hypothetical protein trd_A0270 [Thermomicrobium roseum DSM 5159]